KMFHTDYLKHYFNVSELRKTLPTISTKVTSVLKIAVKQSKDNISFIVSPLRKGKQLGLK
ncbi:MAG: hypothetical protein ABUK08_05150, partial [Candidatus Humimicrobiaceae bacterium]